MMLFVVATDNRFENVHKTMTVKVHTEISDHKQHLLFPVP